MSSPSDLTTVADCKAWLGLASPADDALLGELITSVSRAIGADLGRTLLPTSCSEILDGGATALPLREWPVSSVVSCTADGAALAASAGPGWSGWVLDAAAPAPPGAMQRLRCRGGMFAPGVANVAVTYRAGYEISGEAAFVPTSAPYVVAALAPYGPWALDTGVTGAPGPYTVAAGVYTFTPAAAGAAVSLAYGYVPADLARAAIEWVADRYAARSRIGQSARTLGGQETASFVVKAMPDVVDRLLRPYRRVAG